ncbi:MAG TPA: hypothetical protein PLZ18_05755, partial [Ferruginibacter sp.]|nr:hypothetical protein [Ferruginibacter sp.]
GVALFAVIVGLLAVLKA